VFRRPGEAGVEELLQGQQFLRRFPHASILAPGTDSARLDGMT
jgi:hypothetical protein